MTVKINITNNNIVFAKYGANKKYIDVLKKINSLINNNHTTIIKINNYTFGKDPCHQVVKKLIIRLNNDSEHIINEDDLVKIVDDKFNINNLNNDININNNILLNLKYSAYTDYSHKKLNNYKKNSDVLCVTTFNKELYEKYGKDFVDTYNFPFDLIIYSEDDMEFLKNKVSYNLDIINIFQADNNFKTFVENNKTRNIEDAKKGFRFDVIRFSYKIFSVVHAGYNFDNYKYLIWLDADMIFKKSLTMEIIESMFIKDNNMMSYLGRGDRYHSDCGFLIFRLSHKYILNYFKEIKNLYLSNKIYKEKEWHDSYIWDLIRKKYEKNFKITNFDIGNTYCKGKGEFNHILTSTPLYEYIDHLKGDIRKMLKTSDPDKFKKYKQKHPKKK